MSPAPSFPSQLHPPSVSPDIYNWDMRYRSVLRRLHSEDSGILEGNRLKIKKFLESREARGLSLPRVIKYGNHLITFSKCCSKHFDEMTEDDVREALVSLKNRNKMDPRCTKMKNGWRGINGSKYSEATIDGFKIMVKIFWRWLKGMDESKPIYPPEVSWIASSKASQRRITVTRSDLLSPEEINLFATATGDAQDAALVKVLDDAGGRISEILTLRIKDVEQRPYGFKLNVWVSKTYAHPIPIAKSAPALARWLSLHPFRDSPNAPLWLNSYKQQMLYGAARRKMGLIIQKAEEISGRKLGKRIWFHLFRHTSATEFMRKGKGSQGVMSKRYGWTVGSRMSSVYAHLVDDDVEEAIAKADATSEEYAKLSSEKSIVERRPKKCDRCESTNDPFSRFCSRCAFPLDSQAAREAFEAEEKKAEAETTLEQIMKDERVRKVMFEVLSEISMKKISREVGAPDSSPSSHSHETARQARTI
jgi:integrase/recombinase XerD